MQEVIPYAAVDMGISFGTPQVSFDVKLGRHFSNIDFDSETYTEYLTSRGLSPEQQSSLSLRFTSHAFNLMSQGTTNGRELSSTVNITPFRSESKINENTYHETEHLIQGAVGSITTGTNVWSATAILMRATGLAIEFGGSITWGASEVTHSPETAAVWGAPLTLGGFLLMAASKYCVWWNAPLEKSARQAASQPLPPLVSMTRKPRLRNLRSTYSE